MNKAILVALSLLLSMVGGIADDSQRREGVSTGGKDCPSGVKFILRDWPDGGDFYSFTRDNCDGAYRISKVKQGGQAVTVFVGSNPFLPSPAKEILEHIPAGAVRFLCEAWVQEMVTRVGLESLKKSFAELRDSEKSRPSGVTNEVLRRYGIGSP
jgi:hypothetical protein